MPLLPHPTPPAFLWFLFCVCNLTTHYCVPVVDVVWRKEGRKCPCCIVGVCDGSLVNSCQPPYCGGCGVCIIPHIPALKRKTWL